jgi:hypothetical protein
LGLHRGVESQFETDPAFFEYKNAFESIYNMRVDVPIVFHHSLEEDVGARCVRSATGWRLIEVNYQMWFNMLPMYEHNSIVYREIVLFHEFAHCIMNKEKHRNRNILAIIGDVEVEIPGSILHSAPMIPPIIYSENRSYFLEELGR